MSHGSEKRARTAGLSIRLTPDERAAIDQAAERAGLTSGSYARDLLLGAPAPRQVRRPPVEKRELARLLGQVGRVGNNINQLSHMAQLGLPTDRAALSRALGDWAEVRAAILAALGRAP